MYRVIHPNRFRISNVSEYWGMSYRTQTEIDFESKPIKTSVDFGAVKYEVEVSDVFPYPKVATEISQKDYKISVTVTKL